MPRHKSDGSRMKRRDFKIGKDWEWQETCMLNDDFQNDVKQIFLRSIKVV